MLLQLWGDYYWLMAFGLLMGVAGAHTNCYNGSGYCRRSRIYTNSSRYLAVDDVSNLTAFACSLSANGLWLNYGVTTYTCYIDLLHISHRSVLLHT